MTNPTARTTQPLTIAVGADERLHVVDVVLDKLAALGLSVTYFGAEAGQTVPWPQVARQVAEAVARGEFDEGILLCWTGTGVSIAANKVPGIRAALCVDAETARGARLWNNANVLCLSMRLTSDVVAGEILETWFRTTYQPNPEDDACLAMIQEMDFHRSDGGSEVQ